MRSWKLRKRDFRFWMQRRFRGGWDDSHTWGLNSYIAEFVLPRLRRFKEISCGAPGYMDNQEEWENIIDDMIYGLDICAREMDEVISCDEADWERVQRGLDAFGHHLRDLWF